MIWLIYAILSAASEALFTVFTQFSINQKTDLTLATTFRSIIMTVILVIASFSLKKFHPTSLKVIATPGFGWVVASELVNGLSWIFYFAALNYGLLSKVTAVGQLNFIFIIIFSMLFLGQTPTPKLLLGSLLIIGGMYFIATE